MSTELTKQSAYASINSEHLAVTKQSAYVTTLTTEWILTQQSAYITVLPKEARSRRRMPLIIN